LFDLSGYQATFGVSTVFLVMAALLAFAASRTDRLQPA
jgi:hypothetical protein